MRIPNARRKPANDDGGTMTPMIDVVFLLLIFFICASARQMKEAILPATLPPGAVSSALAATDQPRIDQAFVKLKQTSEQRTIIEMNGTDYASVELIESQLKVLAEIAPETPIILDIEGGVPFGDVIHVYDLCQKLRFQTIKFAIDFKKAGLSSGAAKTDAAFPPAPP